MPSADLQIHAENVRFVADRDNRYIPCQVQLTLDQLLRGRVDVGGKGQHQVSPYLLLHRNARRRLTQRTHKVGIHPHAAHAEFERGC